MTHSPESLRQQLLTHLQLVHASGIDWLPSAPPLVISQTTKPADDASTASMFDIAEETAAAEGGLSIEERRVALQTLADEVKTCMRCAELCSTRTQTVFGDGEPGVELCFVGEAPGADEDAQGVPFVGAAGQLLNKIIAAMGFKRDEVYICNILRCRPPGNRTPLADEASNCRPFLERQLALVQPKFLVALGGCAATNLLQTTMSIGRLRGRFHNYKGVPLVVTYHPAYLLPHKHPEMKREVWEDMKMLLTRMGRPIPQKSQ
ncbi:MAG: uracil-DNA glycosylase [Planctomycetes bacterium]|nr:uracil-DNA glycosylase [Planctomycetota bacterium]